MSIVEFLEARIAEDEATAREAAGFEDTARRWEVGQDGNAIEPDVAPTVWAYAAQHIARHDPARVLAECEAKRRIVDLHQNWPVLVEAEPQMRILHDDPLDMAVSMSQQFAWLTEQEYRSRFGDEPPTTPMLRALASVYADHPDFDLAWRT